MIKVYLTICLGVNQLSSNKVELIVAGMDKIECWIMSHGIMPGQYLVVACQDRDVAVYKIDYHNHLYQISGKTDLLIDATHWVDLTIPYKSRLDLINGVCNKLFSRLSLHDLIDNPDLFRFECDVKLQMLNSKFKTGDLVECIQQHLQSINDVELKNKMMDALYDMQKYDKMESVFIDWGEYSMSQTNQIATD